LIQLYKQISKELEEVQDNNVKLSLIKYQLELVKKLGFSSIDEAEKEILPYTPEEIVMFCKYLRLFDDEETIYQLKPLLYVFWS
jgi:hypothetical protein